MERSFVATAVRFVLRQVTTETHNFVLNILCRLDRSEKQTTLIRDACQKQSRAHTHMMAQRLVIHAQYTYILC